jgi:hypothetical protein
VPLQRQIVSIPLTQGLDTKTAKVLVPQGKMAVIQNARFIQGPNGAGLQKRNGYTALPSLDTHGGTVEGGSSLALYNDQLLVFDGAGQAYTLSESQGALAGVGEVAGAIPAAQEFVSFGVEQTQVSKSLYSAQSPDAATCNGVTVYAFTTTQGGVIGTTFVVIEEATGLQFYEQRLANLICPRVVTDGTNLFVWGILASAGGLWCGVIHPTAPQTFVTFTEVDSSAGQVGPLDVIWSGAIDSFVASYLTTDFVVSVIAQDLFSFSSSTVVSSVSSLATVSLVVVDGTGDLSVVYSGVNGATQVAASFLELPGLSVVNTFTLDSSATCPLATQAQSFVSLSEMTIYYQCEGSGGTLRQVRRVTVDEYTGIVSGPGIYLRGIALAGNAFNFGPTTYVPVVFISDDQQSFFLLNQNAAPVATFSQNNAGPYSTNGRLPTLFLPSTLVAAFAFPDLVLLESDNGSTSFVTGVAEWEFDFNDGQIQAVQLGQNLQLTGPIPRNFDGAVFVEQGFCNCPDTITITNTDSLAYWANAVTPDATPPFMDIMLLLTVPTVAGTGVTPVGSGATTDGQLIAPGDYFVFAVPYPTNAAFGVGSGLGAVAAVWYSVNGVGSAPTWTALTPPFASYFTSLTALEVAILSTDSAASIITKTTAVLVAFMNATPGFSSGDYVLTNPSPSQLQISFTPVAADTLGLYVAPSWSTAFLAYCAVPSSSASGTSEPGAIGFNACPASLILPGQYATFDVAQSSGATASYYIWFTVDGVGVDPQPNGIPSGNGTVVPVFSGEDSTTVATAIATALGSTSLWSAFSVGPLVELLQSYSTTTQPYWLQTSSGNVGAGHLGAGDGTPGSVPVTDAYQYVALYERVDNAGQIHRSPVSIPVSIGLPSYGAIAPYVVTLTVPQLQLTSARFTSVVIYRTIANGTIFYRVTPPSAPILTTVNAGDFVTFLDSTPDSEIQGNELLYTTGGVLENDQAPPMSFLCVHQDRLWGITEEDPTLLWYSKQFESGLEVGWSNEQTIRIDAVGGDAMGMASMDANLIIFAQSRIWLVSGYGPDQAGNGTQFGLPQLIASGSGLRDPRSLALTPDGLTYKSYKGWYFLDRGLQATYFGADVEAFNDDVVTAATLIAGTTEIRFLSASGTTLLFDYYYKQWGTFTNHQGLDAVNYNGVYTYLRVPASPTTAIAIYQEAQQAPPANPFDVTTGFALLATTAWLKVGSMQAFGRLWRAYWLGFFPGTNAFQVGIAYNYNPTIIDTHVFNQGAGTSPGSLVFPGLGAGHTYVKTLGANVLPGSFVLKIQGGGTLATDDGAGNISGAGGGGVTGTINYATGSASFTITDAETSNNLEVDWLNALSFADVIQLRVSPSIQKIEAVQFTVQDLGPWTPNYSKALQLSALDLECGIKKGGFKSLPPGQSF